MMFGCEETRRYVDAWVDGELDPGAALHVETHVSRCCGCREEADMIRSIKRAMAGMRESEQAPSSLRCRLSAALDAEDAGQQQAVNSAQRRKHAAGFVLAGAALAGFVFATGRHSPTTASSLDVASASVLPQVLEDITSRHVRDLPVEVSGSQPEQVTNFFRNRLDIPVRPLFFRGVPAHLVGGRISNVRDQLAAALYYELGGRRMTVFVFDSALLPRASFGLIRSTIDNQDVYVGNAHGYNVAFSERGGVGYAVATDLPPEQAARIAASAEIR